MQEPQVNMEAQDIQQNKAVAVIGYILFFVPLLAARESKFAMYHANQALTLFLTALACNIVFGMIPIIGWFLLLPLGNIAILVLAVLGILNAANGSCKPLPVIGKYTFIK